MTGLRVWGLKVALLVGFLAWISPAFAEEVKVTTYYPSPAGDYNELRSTGNTYLATSGGNVGVGTLAPAAKLDVAGAIQSSGNITTSGGNISTTSGNLNVGSGAQIGASTTIGVDLTVSGVTRTNGGLKVEKRTDDNVTEEGRIWLR